MCVSVDLEGMLVLLDQEGVSFHLDGVCACAEDVITPWGLSGGGGEGGAVRGEDHLEREG